MNPIEDIKLQNLIISLFNGNKEKIIHKENINELFGKQGLPLIPLDTINREVENLFTKGKLKKNNGGYSLQ